MSFLRIWGCEAHVKRLTSNKLTSKTDKCLFVGYLKETKGYYFYIPNKNKVFVTRKAKNSLFSRKKVGVKYNLKKFKNHKIL